MWLFVIEAPGHKYAGQVQLPFTSLLGICMYSSVNCLVINLAWFFFLSNCKRPLQVLDINSLLALYFVYGLFFCLMVIFCFFRESICAQEVGGGAEVEGERES